MSPSVSGVSRTASDLAFDLKQTHITPEIRKRIEAAMNIQGKRITIAFCSPTAASSDGRARLRLPPMRLTIKKNRATALAPTSGGTMSMATAMHTPNHISPNT